MLRVETHEPSAKTIAFDDDEVTAVQDVTLAPSDAAVDTTAASPTTVHGKRLRQRVAAQVTTTAEHMLAPPGRASDDAMTPAKKPVLTDEIILDHVVLDREDAQVSQQRTHAVALQPVDAARPVTRRSLPGPARRHNGVARSSTSTMDDKRHMLHPEYFDLDEDTAVDDVFVSTRANRS